MQRSRRRTAAAVCTLAVAAVAAVLAGCSSPGTTSSAGSASVLVPGTDATGGMPTGTGSTGAGGPCGGQPTVVVDGSTWDCVFDSEFSGTSLNSAQWAPVTTAASGYTAGPVACYVDSPANISVGGGYLSLTARAESAPFTCHSPLGDFSTQYTSGTVATAGRFSLTYGRVDVRAKVPATAVPGLQSSFWLFPATQKVYGHWPTSGEIDIAETYSQYPGVAIPYIHYSYDASTTNASTDTNVVTAYDCAIDPDAFNDYVVEWTTSAITMEYDGRRCLVDHWVPAAPLSHPQPFDLPFFLNLTQALGVGTNRFDPSSTPLPATTEVQYVRVWQQAGAGQ